MEGLHISMQEEIAVPGKNPEFDRVKQKICSSIMCLKQIKTTLTSTVKEERFNTKFSFRPVMTLEK
jgi:hypothetical protein